MNPFEAYVKYLAYKMHFTNPGYNYIKYNGKVKADPKTFDLRRDKYMFHKLSKVEDLDNYLIANMMEQPTVWVGDLFNDKSRAYYSDMTRRQQSLTYLFETDLNKVESLQDDVKCRNGKHPKILKMYKQGDIAPESLIILDRLMGIFSYWDKKIDETYIWPATKLKLEKYASFLHFDQKKMKAVLKGCIYSTEA